MPHGGQWHGATVAGSALKLVRCENCGYDYVYRMERTVSWPPLLWWARRSTRGGVLRMERCASASTTAQERARREALRRLQDALDNDSDAVPCPQCGWYQQAMIPAARRQWNRWMYYTGLVLISPLMPALLMTWGHYVVPRPPPAWSPWLLAGAALLAGLAFGLIIYRKRRASSYDPNTTDEDARKALGQSRELLGADRDNMLRARQAEGGSMAKKPQPGDRVRVTTWTGLPDYLPGDKGTVLKGPEPSEGGEPSYLVAMDEGAGKGLVLFIADEIEVDV